LERLLGIARDFYVIAVSAQKRTEYQSDIFLVIDYEHSTHYNLLLSAAISPVSGELGVFFVSRVEYFNIKSIIEGLSFQ
jgi:hypothetical protein